MGDGGQNGRGGGGELAQLREHLALVVDVLPVMIYRARGTGAYDTLWVSKNAAELTGFSADDHVADGGLWFSRLHPEDVESVVAAFERARGDDSYAVEYRWRHRDGHYIWFLDHGRKRRVADSDEPQLFGVAIDTTGRREAQDQRARLLDELISAQEVERKRISRELHDALGQTMTSLAMRIAGLEELSRSGRDITERLADLKQVANRAVSELSSLAHTLRPPAIDELGFVAALHGLVSDFASAHGLAVDVHVRGLEPDARLAPAVESSLYRMVQEALNNVIKHSGADRVSVILDRRGYRVSLIVEDDGCGFDATASSRGLGLSGLRERAALLGGNVAIESRPGGGTTVRVTVPKA